MSSTTDKRLPGLTLLIGFLILAGLLLVLRFGIYSDSFFDLQAGIVSLLCGLLLLLRSNFARIAVISISVLVICGAAVELTAVVFGTFANTLHSSSSQLYTRLAAAVCLIMLSLGILTYLGTPRIREEFDSARTDDNRGLLIERATISVLVSAMLAAFIFQRYRQHSSVEQALRDLRGNVQALQK